MVRGDSSRAPDLGWHPDPDEPGRERYWNGAEWTRSRPAPASPSADSGSRHRTPQRTTRVPIIAAAGMTALVGVGVAVAVMLAGESTPAIVENDAGERSEVSVTTCEPPTDEVDQTVRGIVENGSSTTSDYRIEVAVYSSDGTRIGTGSTDALDIEPGTSAVWVADTDAIAADWDDGSTCEITDVERSASL